MAAFLVLTDDITGALDTGISFVNNGIKTCIRIDPQLSTEDFHDSSVLVINTNSRHLPPKAAYEVVYMISRRARECGIRQIYKKVDSTLRGNIGAELAAVIDGLQCNSLAFAPAYPSLGRTTVNGVQYINSVPVAESEFGTDPFEPVRHSDICRVIGEQTDKPVTLLSPPEMGIQSGINVFDAKSDDDLFSVARYALEKNISALAGCAGLARAMAQRMTGSEIRSFENTVLHSLFVVCGSMNHVTKAQLTAAEECGFSRFHLEKKHLSPVWLSSSEGVTFLEKLILLGNRTGELCMIDVLPPEDFSQANGATLSEDARQATADGVGRIVLALWERGLDAPLLCTGGDTLLSIIRATGIKEIWPIGEISPGVVVSEVNWQGSRRTILSKSGGFGDKMLFCSLLAKDYTPV